MKTKKTRDMKHEATNMHGTNHGVDFLFYIFTIRGLLVMGLLFCLPCSAGTDFTIEQFTTMDGLVNNTVRHITQDSRGRLWFATINGVSLYENGKFTNIYPERNKRRVGLCDQRVTSFYEDGEGRMWISTVYGMSCYDVKRDVFIDHRAEGIREPLLKQAKHNVMKDRQGRTWRVTENNGLFIINKEGKSEHFTTESKSCPLPSNSLKCIFQDKDGDIWIGTNNVGVSRITVMSNYGVDYLMEGENIRMITHLGKDKIAVANRKGDVWIYDSMLTTVLSHERYQHNTYCMCEDARHNIWRGTKGGGIYMNDIKLEGVPHEQVYSVREYNEGEVWIGTFGGGVLTYDYATGNFTGRFLHKDLGSMGVRAMEFLDSDNIWIATSNGVHVLSQNANSKKHLCTGNGLLYSDEVRTIFKSSKNEIYIAETGVGFAVYDKGELTHYTKEDSLVNDMVQCFVEDRHGYVWIATEFGISRFDPSTHKFSNYFFSSNMLKNVYNENSGLMLADGRVVFGSHNGIVVINPNVYDDGRKLSGIGIKDITLNGNVAKKEWKTIMLQWWKSPWAITCLAAIVLLGICAAIRIRRKKNHYDKQISDLNSTNEVLANEKHRLQRDVQMRKEAALNEQEMEFVRQVENIVNAQISNSDFSADDFAEQIGMGRTIFFRKMKNATGYSPKEYIKLVRIHRAADLMATTNRTISEIAYMVGINNPLYFSRIFKAEYHCTPTEWRRQNTATSDVTE